MAEIEWKCPECGQTGSYLDLRHIIDHGVDSCPDCSTEVVNCEDELRDGDVVELGKVGDAEKDLMYSGWKAMITKTGVNDAYVDSDEYVRKTGNLQAVSFKTWWPLKALRIAE